MVTHTRNLWSAFTRAHTRMHARTRSSGQPFMLLRPGSSWGVRCLAQAHLSHGIEGGESTVHSLPPPTIPAETQTRKLSITSLTLSPLGHDLPTINCDNSLNTFWFDCIHPYSLKQHDSFTLLLFFSATGTSCKNNFNFFVI